MRRGDIYTAVTGGDYGGKPGPVLVLQADDFCASPRIVVTRIGSASADPPSLRIPVGPSSLNGLHIASEIQLDIIMTVSVRRFGKQCGRLEKVMMERVDERLLELLGFNGIR